VNFLDNGKVLRKVTTGFMSLLCQGVTIKCHVRELRPLVFGVFEAHSDLWRDKTFLGLTTSKVL
jgi:hypothetical protein